jgi:hypothetical protein
MVPRSALEQEAEQDRLTSVAIAGVRRVWRRMRGRNWERAWRNDVGPAVSEVITTAQAASAARSSQYVGDVLRELEIEAKATTRFLPDAFAGVAGDGRTVESLAYGAVITAVKAQYSSNQASMAGLDAEAAWLAEAETFMEGVVAGIMADTARAAEVAATAQRPWVKGYVRMMEPGACSRCAALAGRFYLFNENFLRHPRCRCIHVPAMEDAPNDPRTNPNTYFESLSPAQQDRVFTKAGAEAIRLGASITQVVNARRGMSTAQKNPRGWIPKGRLTPVDVAGKPTFITTEGVGKRGVARRAMGSGRPVRLMPESIMALAQSPEDAIRLLTLYGYLEP